MYDYDKYGLEYHNAYRKYIEYYPKISDVGFNFKDWLSFNKFLQDIKDTYTNNKKIYNEQNNIISTSNI